MSYNVAVIIRFEEGRELQTLFVGTVAECKAKLFNRVIPNELTKNIQQVESDFGYRFVVEEFGEGKWKKVEYYLQMAKDNNL